MCNEKTTQLDTDMKPLALISCHFCQYEVFGNNELH